MADKEVRPAIDFTKLIPPEVMAWGLTAVQIASIASGVGAVVGAVQAIQLFFSQQGLSFEEVVQSKLTAIEQKLDQYYIDLVGLQRATAFSSTRQNIDILIAPLVGAALAAKQWANQNKNAPNAESLRFEPVGIGINEVASRNALIALAGSSFFEQPTIAKPLADVAAIQRARELGLDPPSSAYWENSIPQVNELGLAFDYRLGIPALLTGLSLRLKVMTANAPDFAKTGVYNDELSIYANRLRWAAQKIESGILTRRGGGGVIPRHSHTVVGQDAGGRNVYGSNEYEATIDAEAACLYTGARAFHRIKGTFSGQSVFAGGYCPLYYSEINDYQCDTRTHAERMLFEMSLRDKHFHNSGYETAQAMVRAKLLHHLGLFEIHAMIDLLETLIDGNVHLVRPQQVIASITHPHGTDGIIQSKLNRSCLEIVNGYDEPGARVAIAPMDNSPYRTRQKWTYDRVTGQVRSDVGTCLALNWNYYDNYGSIYWLPTRYDSAITRGVQVTTAYGIAERGKVYTGQSNYALDAQRWTFNPRTGLLRNALGGGTVVLDVMWGNSTPGTRVWAWDINGAVAQQWYSHRKKSFPFVDVIFRTRKSTYLGYLSDTSKMQFEHLEEGHPLLASLSECNSCVAGPVSERIQEIDLRDTMEDLEFPLRLTRKVGENMHTEHVEYVLIYEDGSLEAEIEEKSSPKTHLTSDDKSIE